MDEKRYFVRDRGKVRGPFDIAQLRALRDRGQFSSFHEISEDRRMWSTASELTDLFGPLGRVEALPTVEEAPMSPRPRRRINPTQELVEPIHSREGRRGLECPSCGSEHVQRREVIYELGTSQIDSTSVGYGGGGMLFGATSGTHRTRAALNAAPPSRRDSTSAVIAAIAGASIAFVAIIAFFGVAIGSDAARGDSTSIAVSLSCLLMALLGVLACVSGIKSVGKINDWNRRKWPRLREAWEMSFRCIRCGQEFIPQ